MSLPTPNLDVRTFQQIVDDAKRQIGLHCPEWTDHNVSDPGVTLIELFASMTEMMLYRMNQVPEKNYIKFLELIGISLETPAPAQTTLRFMLSRPTEDEDSEDTNERFLPGHSTIAATQRTQFEDSIEFSTDHDLRLTRPKLTYILALDQESSYERATEGVRPFLDREKRRDRDSSFKIFSTPPVTGNALYFGFEADVNAHIIQIHFSCLRSAATGLNELYPAQVWEVWQSSGSKWDRIEVLEDSIYGFNRSGHVQLCLPDGLTPTIIAGRRAIWIRCRYTVDPMDTPPQGVEGRRPDPYQKSPEILSVSCATVGGSVRASNALSVRDERIGESDGLPGQVFLLSRSPVLKLIAGETLEVGKDDGVTGDGVRWVPWTQVEDFSGSKPEDEHFVCDYLSGQILLGPSIIEPNGSMRQYGAIPPKGSPLRITSYRVGGGAQGNVREGKIRTLKSAIPYIADVVNPIAATGGTDRETLERAKLRAKQVLQVRNRAVTAEDFELLAAESSKMVGRARCIQPSPSTTLTSGLRPGLVRVLLVPKLPEDLLMPNARDLVIPSEIIRQVETFLDRRRLLTTTLEVNMPEYLFVSVDVRLVADPKADAEIVARNVRTRLYEFLNPLTGGPNGDGWPFNRTLTLADLYAQVGAVGGVAFLLDIKIAVSEIIDKNEWLLGPERQVRIEEGGVRLEDGWLFSSRYHTVRAVPMSAVGSDPMGNTVGR